MTDWIPVLALLVALTTPIAAVAVARSSAASSMALAATARVQERRAALYLDIMTFAMTLQDWVDRTQPVFSMSSDPGPPTIPSDDEQRSLRARIGAYASRAVRARYLELMQAAASFQMATFILDEFKKVPVPTEGVSIMDRRMDVDAKRQRVRDGVAAVELAMNSELDELASRPGWIRRKGAPPLGRAWERLRHRSSPAE